MVNRFYILKILHCLVHSNASHRHVYYDSRRHSCPVRDDSEYRFHSFSVTIKETCHAHCRWAGSRKKHYSIKEFIAIAYRCWRYRILIIDTSTQQLEVCKCRFWAWKMSTLANSSWWTWFGTCFLRSNDKARTRQWCSYNGAGYCFQLCWSIKAVLCCECWGSMP